MPLFRPTAGYFKICLTWEKRDWESCKAFIKEIKANIEIEDRSYDEESHEWEFKERCLPVVRDFWNKYFSDPNQQDMFE
ncbi:MAG TPA: hypothetical protein ENO22_05805 [candidate division Zixibacteria bacterium]|nr:hypothetical protein [candidate division Zixibacteria bacterium]HEQ98838.1 hypothetical protein [candidate division Zixibacteria bacterium]